VSDSSLKKREGNEKRSELAVRSFLQSMNCAQAVVEVYALETDISEETARRIAAAFAAGMGCGEICGAVSGALMVLGLRYGKTKPKDSKADKHTFAKAAEFVAEFRKHHGSLQCSHLLGVDMGTREGVEEARSKGYFKKICPQHVRSAVKILDEIAE